MRYFVVEYFKQRDGKYNEQVSVHKQVKNNLMQRAMVVLDFKERKVVKLRLDEGDRDFDRVVQVYVNQGYEKVIGELEEGYRLINAINKAVEDAKAEANTD